MQPETIWLMDSEFCCRCGCILDWFEVDLCTDCLHDARRDEEQDYYADWEYEEGYVT